MNGMSLSNVIGDVLSTLFNLQHLDHLDLSLNYFEGVSVPRGLGILKSLCYMVFSFTTLSGDIPMELGNMSTLQYLDLSSSYLRMVDMRMWMGNMGDLRELILDEVNMSGVDSNDELDSTLSTMYSYTCLRLRTYHLQGVVPLSLAKLINLTHLQLDDNGFIVSSLIRYFDDES